MLQITQQVVMIFAKPLTETNIIRTFYENYSRGKGDKEGTYYSRLKLVIINCGLDLE